MSTIRLLMWMASSMCLPTLMAQSIYDWDVGPLKGAQLETVRFRAWIPSGDQPLNGVLVLVPGRHGDGRGMALDPKWQEVAEDVRFAILACQYADGDKYAYQHDPDDVVSKSIEEAVRHLGKESGHPELEAAPLAFWGHSAGSLVSFHFCEYAPERVAAYASCKGPGAPGREMPKGKDEVPMFIAVGAKDKEDWVKPALESYEVGHEEKAPWILAYHKNEGHEAGGSTSAIRPFLKKAIRMRLAIPEGSTTPGISMSGKLKLAKINVKEGWLGDPETYEIASYDDFQGKKKAAIWLPDETVAKAWQEYLK